MFTGIVEEVGIVKNITASGKSGKIRICANKVRCTFRRFDSSKWGVSYSLRSISK